MFLEIFSFKSYKLLQNLWYDVRKNASNGKQEVWHMRHVNIQFSNEIFIIIKHMSWLCHAHIQPHAKEFMGKQCCFPISLSLALSLSLCPHNSFGFLVYI